MHLNDLETQRLTLETVTDNYHEDLFDYNKEPDFFKFLEFAHYDSIDETRTYLKKLLERHSKEDCHYWFIKDKVQNKVIGTFGVIDYDSRKASVEIGYGLSPKFWGKGLFKEVLGVVIPYLFKEKNMHRIWAKTYGNNHASIEGLKKLSFKEEGRLRDYYLDTKDGKYYDAAILSILKGEYKEQ